MLASYTTWALSLYLLSSQIGNAQAQVATVTLPYADGDTLVVSTGTNALGLPTTFATLPVAGGAGAVAPVNTLTNTLTNTATRTTATRAPGAGAGGAGAGAAAEQETAPAAGAGAGAGQIVQGDTLPPPQKTFSYNLDGVDHTWTAVTTRLATIATALVPQGTLQNFEAYQSAVNGRVFEDAKDKEEEKLAAQGGGRATGGAGASFRVGKETGGMLWAMLWIGVVGGLGMTWF